MWWYYVAHVRIISFTEYHVKTTPKPTPSTTIPEQKSIEPWKYNHHRVNDLNDQAFTYDQEIRTGQQQTDHNSRGQRPGPNLQGKIVCRLNTVYCTTIHRYPIFSMRYSVKCKVYTGYHGTSEIEHSLCACTVDNHLAKARRLSFRTGAQIMLYLSLVPRIWCKISKTINP